MRTKQKRVVLELTSRKGCGNLVMEEALNSKDVYFSIQVIQVHEHFYLLIAHCDRYSVSPIENKVLIGNF